MKRIVRYIMITGLMAVLSAPVVYAREGRQGRGRDGNRTEQSHNSGNNKPGQRPANKGSRPGNQSHGDRPQQGPKPGNHHPSANKPSPGHGHGYAPGHKPGHNPGPAPRPMPKPVPPHGHHAPARPLPPPRHDHWPGFHRPTPPPHYVYRGHGPSFGSILGMVLGTAFNVSLNYLNHNGYTVSGYGSNTIYLSNVSQMNFMWPNAVLYYNNGMLASSQYIYSTSWHDMSRYNMLYNSFTRQFGYPVSVNNHGVNMSASWFGNDGRFVTIQYSPGYASNGTGCYYTTLSFGN